MPRQARAQDTVEVIFEASARILEKQGRAALNTNYIAECAGISVATLYQYFPNKSAILLAMARREIKKASAAVIQAITDESGAPSDRSRDAIRALIAEFGTRRKARHLTFQTLVEEGLSSELEKNMDDMAQAIAASTHRILPGRTAPMSPVSAFILTRAVNGVLASAASEGSPYLGTAEFEDELVRLVRGFLADIPVR